jgi:Lar family restriction alleviation protein
METVKLKPCPFCGGEATVMEAVGEVWVKCSECHSSNGVSTGDRARAIAAWNTRKEECRCGEPLRGRACTCWYSKTPEQIAELAADACEIMTDADLFELVKRVDPQAVRLPPGIKAIATAIAAAEREAWKEAAIGWTVAASVHERWAKGRDALYTTRHKDFDRHAEDARQRHALLTPNASLSGLPLGKD